jgi:dolichol-phosphate mannosyltransferase
MKPEIDLFEGPGILAVVIPVYNETATVDLIIERVLNQPCVAQVIAIDDGSSDGSAEKLRRWPNRDSRVQSFFHSGNLGKGAAIRTGLPHIRADWVIIQDADLEYEPSEFVRLLAPVLREGAEVVYGSRFIESNAEVERWHYWGNAFLTWVSNRMTRLNLTDQATGYKLFSTTILRSLNLNEDGFGFCPEVTAKIAATGAKLVEVPISYHPRSRKDGKKIRLWDGLHALECVAKYGGPLFARFLVQRFRGQSVRERQPGTDW